ncbi:hypothetical protein C3B44_01030 [Corynebacterium yudongzhengii]|uniref:TadE-like protein n=1 Tax=Corynebacterium yudongzhengii TaxID=2080740 RepID=A0A2U1T5D0_9CORY|nr:hypothetical protein [Corynebacterium yudongzhengii]AWB81098.1 hypothetical protein C3B44_01030 [Corynebacterium yudongzhengii]PWC01210.1 hypothetical protein DF222_08500 [Corynebacterium yudongzhengii]
MRIDDRGSVSIEAALALSSLVIVAAAIIGALATMGAHLAAIHAASAGARAYAIGTDYAPARGHIEVTTGTDTVTVTATVPAVFGDMTATAVAPLEGH